MGCNVCNSHHRTEECPMLVDGNRITDSILPQRAFLTLPKNLESRALGDGRFDIISTADLPLGTQFGPFLAPKYKRLNSSCAYQLPIFRGNRILHYLDTTNLSKCNWMSLVRFTDDETMRNTICYQLKDEIYFSVVTVIKKRQPLVVCYSPGYFSLMKKIKECDSRSLAPQLQSETVKMDVQKLHTDHLQSEQASDTVIDHDYFTPTSPSVINDAGDNEPLVKKVINNCSTLRVVGTRSSKRLKKRKMRSSGLRNKTLLPAKVEKVKSIKGNKEECTFKKKKDMKRQKRRICYPIRHTEIWECKFCHVQMNIITSFAQHLIEHYKCFKSIEDKLDKNEQEIDPSLLQPTLPYTCDICRKVKCYTRLETIIRHLRIAHGSIAENAVTVNHDYIQCHGCRQYFGNENFYRNHACEEPSVNGCCICNIVFENQTDLRTHLSSHTENDFICPNCRKILTNVSYEVHISVCRTVRNALDDLATGNINCCWKGCQEDLLDLQSFQTHLAEHTHPFLCSKCFLRLRNPKELNTHRCKKLVCDKCLQLFDTVLQLKDHINQDHSNLCKVLSCFECTKPFATLEGYVEHEDCEEASRLAFLTGNQSSTDENVDVKYVCEFCGATYSNMSSLKTHRNTHLEKKFVCKKCNKRFTRKALLQDHYHVHTDPQFSCLICGSKLKTLKSLTVHMRIHKESKPFTCTVCGKGFAQKINLQTHSRSHIPAEEKRHEICDQCGKKFFSPEYLKLHAKTHQTNGEKFACDICNAEFLRPYILHQHKKTVHGNNVYKCEFCERNVRFRQKYSLHRHWMKEHPSDKDTWEAEGYLSSMLIPGDGSLCHPRTKKTPALSQTEDEHATSASSASNTMKRSNVSHIGKTRQSAKRSKKVNLDIRAKQIVPQNPPMPESLEIENEVTVGEDDSSKTELTLTLDDETTDMFSKTISHPNMKAENLILLQLDDDGRYVIAFSHDLS